MKNKRVDCDMCPECLDEISDELWMIYYEQYYESLELMNEENKRRNNTLFLPMLLLLAQYMEIWMKSIAVNYGAGAYGKIEADVILGHNSDALMQNMINIISEEEWEKSKVAIWEIDEVYSYFNEMTENKLPLTIATRYPKTKDNHSTLCSCILNCLSGECECFDLEKCHSNIDRILKLTYEVYDKIYEMRTR